MSIYFLPALVALLVKLIILAYVIKGGRMSIVFLSLVVVFAIHNAIEVSGYLNMQSTYAVETFFRLYYVATIYVVLYMLLHGLAVSKFENKLLTGILIFTSTTIACVVVFSDLIIAGHYSIGYSLSAVKGPIYWIFSLYLLLVLSANVMVLSYGYRRSAAQIDSVRCAHSLLALAPVMLVFALAITFKIANIGINATGLVPIATAFFLAIVLKTEAKHKLSDLRRLMPLSPERATTHNLMDLLDGYIQNSGKSNVYKELQEGIEREIILYSINKCDGNISNATRMMGLKNRSTLYSMLNRLKIDLQDCKANS